MNQRQLTILLVLGLVIGGLGVILYNRNTSSWQASDKAMGQKILKDFPLNDIGQIRLKQGDGELNLAKVNDQWCVKERWGYPANFSEISDLLRKMWELKSVQTLQVGPSQYGRFKLLSPEKEKGTNVATLLEFKDKSGNTVRSLLVGKSATRSSDSGSPLGGGDYPVGRYVAVPDNLQDVWLVSETLSDVEPKPDHWLNKDFFKVEKLRSISVTQTNANNSWKLVREKEGGDLELADKRPSEDFDKNKAYSAGNALSYPSFNDVADRRSKPEQISMEKPIVAEISTFEDFVYSVRVAPATNDTYYLQINVDANFPKERTVGKDEKPEDKAKLDKDFQDKLKKLEEKLKQEKSYEKWTYLVSKWTIDPVLKERKDFIAEKKPDEKKESKSESTSAAPEIKALPDGLTPPLPVTEVKPAARAESTTGPKPVSGGTAAQPAPPVPDSEKK